MLPAGFYDLVGEAANYFCKVRDIMFNNILEDGYTRTMPASITYKEDLSKIDELSKKKTLDNQAFSFMDPESNKMIELNSDITLQAMRIYKARFQVEKTAKKLGYCSNICRLSSTSSNLREELHVGAEIIGMSEFDEELIHSNIKLAINSLLKLDKITEEELIITVRIPGYSEKISGDINSEYKMPFKIETDRYQLDYKKEDDKKAIKLLKSLNKHISLLQKDFKKICIVVDLTGEHTNIYHKDFSFVINTISSIAPLIIGGTYEETNNKRDITKKGETEQVNIKACGFSSEIGNIITSLEEYNNI